MRAEGGQWQYHVNHEKTAAAEHKEGNKKGKPETVRMPNKGRSCNQLSLSPKKGKIDIFLKH